MHSFYFIIASGLTFMIRNFRSDALTLKEVILQMAETLYLQRLPDLEMICLPFHPSRRPTN